MPSELLLTDAPTEQEHAAIENGLIAFNRLNGVPNDWRPLAVLIREGDRTIGGLTGWTMWGWLFVTMFFVPAAQRGQGLGTRILRMAEDEARRRGCTGVWLDTHDWQAPRFYEKLGYTGCGGLPDYPHPHRRYFMQKRLSGIRQQG
jgi:GNAT superfamily N-acetyltransferase